MMCCKIIKGSALGVQVVPYPQMGGAAYMCMQAMMPMDRHIQQALADTLVTQ